MTEDQEHAAMQLLVPDRVAVKSSRHFQLVRLEFDMGISNTTCIVHLHADDAAQLCESIQRAIAALTLESN